MPGPQGGRQQVVENFRGDYTCDNLGLCDANITGDLANRQAAIQKTDSGFNFLQLSDNPSDDEFTIGRAVRERRNEVLLLDRFTADVDWADFTGNSGPAGVVGVSGQTVSNPLGSGPVSEQSGLFWFSSSDNWELLVKVLDGCDTNGSFWVFFAATTNVEFTVTVTDTQTNATRQYLNPLGGPPPAIQDTTAFSTCP